jgi:hypothetical protein
VHHVHFTILISYDARSTKRQYIFFGATVQIGARSSRFEVYRSHTIRYTHPVRILRTSDQLVAKTATYITHNKHMRYTPMPSAGFEPDIPAIMRSQTYALDSMATEIGKY